MDRFFCGSSELPGRSGDLMLSSAPSNAAGSLPHMYVRKRVLSLSTRFRSCAWSVTNLRHCRRKARATKDQTGGRAARFRIASVRRHFLHGHTHHSVIGDFELELAVAVPVLGDEARLRRTRRRHTENRGISCACVRAHGRTARAAGLAQLGLVLTCSGCSV